MRIVYSNARILGSGGRNLVQCHECRKILGKILSEGVYGGEVSISVHHQAEAHLLGYFTLSCVSCRLPLLKFVPDATTETQITTTTTLTGGTS